MLQSSCRMQEVVVDAVKAVSRRRKRFLVAMKLNLRNGDGSHGALTVMNSAVALLPLLFFMVDFVPGGVVDAKLLSLAGESVFAETCCSVV